MAIRSMQPGLKGLPNRFVDFLKNLARIIHKHRWAYLFISPFFILFILFFLYPTIQSFRLSLFKWEGFGIYNFVGIDNYMRLLKDCHF